MFLGCLGYILMLCWGICILGCLDNSYFVGDGMGDTLGIMVGCLHVLIVGLWVCGSVILLDRGL